MQIFLIFSAFTFFWLGIRYELVNSMDLGFKTNWSIVWVITGRRGVSSERRRSSCSSWYSEWCNPWTNTRPSTIFFCVWQNAVSNLYIFDHQRVDISLVNAQCWSVSTRWSKVDHCEIWIFVKCGFLPSSCISQFVIMEIIYKHYKLRIEHFSHSLG